MGVGRVGRWWAGRERVGRVGGGKHTRTATGYTQRWPVRYRAAGLPWRYDLTYWVPAKPTREFYVDRILNYSVTAKPTREFYVDRILNYSVTAKSTQELYVDRILNYSVTAKSTREFYVDRTLNYSVTAKSERIVSASQHYSEETGTADHETRMARKTVLTITERASIV